MSSCNPAVMNKVDLERADVLRAELGQLCWLTIHDKTSGDSERLLGEKLAAARAAATRAAAEERLSAHDHGV